MGQQGGDFVGGNRHWLVEGGGNGRRPGDHIAAGTGVVSGELEIVIAGGRISVVGQVAAIREGGALGEARARAAPGELDDENVSGVDRGEETPGEHQQQCGTKEEV